MKRKSSTAASTCCLMSSATSPMNEELELISLATASITVSERDHRSKHCNMTRSAPRGEECYYHLLKNSRGRCCNFVVYVMAAKLEHVNDGCLDLRESFRWIGFRINESIFFKNQAICFSLSIVIIMWASLPWFTCLSFDGVICVESSICSSGATATQICSASETVLIEKIPLYVYCFEEALLLFCPKQIKVCAVPVLGR